MASDGRVEFKRYKQAQAKIAKMFESDLRKFCSMLDESKPYECKDALLEFYPALVYRYWNASAALAAEYFESESVRQTGELESAFIPEQPPIEQLQAQVRYAVWHLFEGQFDGE